MQRFEAIYLRNLSQVRDYDNLMDLDLSKNALSESSIKYLADLLRKFQGFRSLTLQALPKLRSDAAYLELVRSLRDNHSLKKLDLSKNNLSQGTLAELF